MVTPSNIRVHPEVMWAQRANEIFLTINVPDVKNPQIDLQEDKLTFESAAGTEGKTYAFELEFNGKIKPETSKRNVTDRNIFMILDKAQHDEAWWPRLQKDFKKPAYLKTDFSRWKDEDDEDDVLDPMMGGMGGGMDFSQMMANMGGGAGGMDMASMMSGMGGGMAGASGGEEDDSDDEEDLPELEDVGEEKSAEKASEE